MKWIHVILSCCWLFINGKWVYTIDAVNAAKPLETDKGFFLFCFFKMTWTKAADALTDASVQAALPNRITSLHFTAAPELFYSKNANMSLFMDNPPTRWFHIYIHSIHKPNQPITWQQLNILMPMRSAEVQPEHQDEEEKWFKWFWLVFILETK